MPPPPTKSSTRRLSDVARHVVIPAGIVTTGYPAVQQKCRALGIEHDDWQQGLGRVILGKRASGKYAATVGGIVLSIPRQVGKTFTVGSIIFALCLLFPRMTVLWTAHHSRTSDETFESLSALARRAKIAPHVRKIRTANGQQIIWFRNGSRIMVGAREHGFGRGFTKVDVEVFDEAQTLTEKALSDMVAATNQAKNPHGALLFFMGTPPQPGDNGEAFSSRRRKALVNKTKAPPGQGFGNMVYVELSADEDADPDDRDQWVVANPSIPDRTPFESMERLREHLGSDEAFMREGLGIWSANSVKHVIDLTTWRNAAQEKSIAVDRFALGLDVNPERTIASVSMAGQRADGQWHIELNETRAGIGWVVPYLTALVAANPQIRALVVDGASQAATLMDEFKVAKLRVMTTDLRQLAAACGSVYTGVNEGWLHHIGQTQLTSSLSVARRRTVLSGKAWTWLPKNSASDITPLVSSTLALWGAMNSTVTRPGRKGSGRTRRAVVL